MPGIDALAGIIEGEGGLLESARKGQIITELGSHPVAEKEAFVAPLAAKGAVFLDGEVAGTPGMVAARKANIFLAGPREAVDRVAPAVKGISDVSLYLGAFGGATKVKLANNILVALDIAGAAQAIAFGLKLGVEKELLLQGARDRQRQLDAAWHPRTLDDRAQVPAAAGAGAGAQILSGAGPRDCRRKRHQDRHHRLPERHLRSRDPVDRRTRRGSDARILRKPNPTNGASA